MAAWPCVCVYPQLACNHRLSIAQCWHLAWHKHKSLHLVLNLTLEKMHSVEKNLHRHQLILGGKVPTSLVYWKKITQLIYQWKVLSLMTV